MRPRCWPDVSVETYAGGAPDSRTDDRRFTYTFVSGTGGGGDDTGELFFLRPKNNVSDLSRVTTSLIIMVVMIMGVFGMGYT